MRRHHVRQTTAAVALLGVVLVLAACGSGTPKSTPVASPSAGHGRFTAANLGATGQLVLVKGDVLTLSTTSGDVTVDYSSTTHITQTTTVTTSNITAGDCILVTGQSASGTVTASSVRLSTKVDGKCATATSGVHLPGAPSGFPSPIPSGGPTTLPSGSAFPHPSGGFGGGSFVTGTVSAVSGTNVTITLSTGKTETVTVPTTVTVTESDTVTSASLTVDSCVTALGKSSKGTVTATALTISPASSNGQCSAFGGRGFGGGGGGSFSGGGNPNSGATTHQTA